MKLTVLVDDLREFKNVDIIFRTAESAHRLLPRIVDLNRVKLLLDHDLGSENKTGYTILKELFSRNIFPIEIIVITSNPIGRQNIYNLIKDQKVYSLVKGEKNHFSLVITNTPKIIDADEILGESKRNYDMDLVR